METNRCRHCGEEIHDWVEFCPHCSEPIEGYARPAGFWIRVGASLVDFLVFIPIAILGFWNTISLKSTTVLVLISLPAFLYKPLMESFFGATLGKMSCRIKVIDEQGKKLSLFRAYCRALPFLVGSAVGLASQLILFSSPQFQSAGSWMEAMQAKPTTVLDLVNPLVSLFILVDCLFVAFTPRKRALHDMLAESFCVYREP